MKKNLLVILSLLGFTIASANVATQPQVEKAVQTVKTNTMKAKKIAPKNKKRVTKKRNPSIVEKDERVIMEPAMQNNSTMKSRTTIHEQNQTRNAAQGTARPMKNDSSMKNNTTILEQNQTRNAAQGKIKTTTKGEANNATSNRIYQEEMNR